MMHYKLVPSSLFSINLPSTPGIYTLSLHDALPVSLIVRLTSVYGPGQVAWEGATGAIAPSHATWPGPDRKSTRLNSSHVEIAYAVFCVKKKKHTTMTAIMPLPTNQT